MAATAQFLFPTFTQLKLLQRGIQIATATGLFVRSENGWGIATNWHALSGRHPETGQPLSDSGATPDTCKYSSFFSATSGIRTEEFSVALGDALQGTAAWKQHYGLGQQADVAVLPIPAETVGAAKNIFDPSGYDKDMFIDIGQEVFLPGYPLGLTGPGDTALWKRASVASSLEIGEGINRFFYVDTATRQGMSGAPCIAVANWRYYRLNRTTGKVSIQERPFSWRLLGIYSGRKNATDGFEAQIGMVWRETLLLDVIVNGAPGSVTLS